MINKAIEFATKAHEGQLRKGTKRPYIVHPVEVADIVSTMTTDEEVISAAVLHDTIEDCKDVTREILAQEFSERVASIVAQESEDKSCTWMERKSATIEHLRTAPWEVQMVGLADKLSNMRDINRDYPVYGEELWNRFRMKDKKIIGWYYKGIMEALADAFRGVDAYEEYCRLDKGAMYQLMNQQLEGLLKATPYRISGLANASALLWETLRDINWAGFYLIEDGKLILGPFQGKVACTEIEIGRGVCGTAVEKDEVLLVENVHEFPGHIACDSASESEIVLPIHYNGEVVGVLDIDSPLPARFDGEDEEGLRKFVEVLERNLGRKGAGAW